ncbi:acylphosphatase [Candidatus Azambacteria bacterium]|nr:acylphosphatase [Candidatus Azambacteria bacterium]
MKERLVLAIFGSVQGVFFRLETQTRARALSLTGWVRNEPDGSVLLVAEGEKERLGELLGWAKNGPTLAKIERIRVEWLPATGEFTDFEIRY